MNVFDCAIKIEEDTKKYYEELEAVSTSPEMKHLFSLLAASEDECRKNLLKLKETVPEKAELEELDGAVCQFQAPPAQRELFEQMKSDPDLYRFAVGQEEHEIQMFEELSLRTKDEATSKSLRTLADAERSHLSMIESIYDFVEAPRTYLAWREFSNLREL